MEKIISMYITLMPVIFAGIFTMIWCCLPILKKLKKPIDAGICLSDGERLFGDNKTWKGFVGYIFMNTLFSVLWGWGCNSVAYLSSHNFFYRSYENTLMYNLLVGVLLGLGYALFELPNSFFKRRLGIIPGKAPTGFKRVFFIFIDQADSLFGCVLVVCLFYKMSVGFYFTYVFVGALTHIILNMLLYFVHLRKNMF